MKTLKQSDDGAPASDTLLEKENKILKQKI